MLIFAFTLNFPSLKFSISQSDFHAKAHEMDALFRSSFFVLKIFYLDFYTNAHGINVLIRS